MVQSSNVRNTEILSPGFAAFHSKMRLSARLPTLLHTETAGGELSISVVQVLLLPQQLVNCERSCFQLGASRHIVRIIEVYQHSSRVSLVSHQLHTSAGRRHTCVQLVIR